MPKTKLFLLRHGQTLSNLESRYQGQGDSPLSEQGLADARRVAETLKSINFSVIYGSPLSRSRKTAEIIAKKHGHLKVEIDKDLMERYYGVFEDMTFQEIKDQYSALYDEWIHNPNQAKIPEAETLEDLQKRGMTAITKIISKHQGDNICVVGHGGINRAIIFHYMGIDLNNFFHIKQDNCCINIIEFAHCPQIVLLNSTYFAGSERRFTKEGNY
ncbi:histidine phosphatase family protein [Candidatus Margulisiibacteriota bacterium]